MKFYALLCMHTGPLFPSANGAHILCSEKYHRPKWPEINQIGFEKSQVSNITITTDFIIDQCNSPNSDFTSCWLPHSVG